MTLVTAMEQRLRSGKYEVSRDVSMPGILVADIAASRTYFSWKGFCVISRHVVISQRERANVGDLQALFDAGLRYGKKTNRILLPPGFQFSYMIIPVVITSNPAPELIEYVTKPPRKHWSLFEFPVVVDADTGATSYFHERVLWGAFYFSEMRAVASTFIEGKTAPSS